ncbi:MAG TPA: sigma-70 family RNA polymerase sigma factor, partial [Polyangiales bacterium]
MQVDAAVDGEWRRLRASARHAPFLELEEERNLLARAAHDPDALSLLIASHMRLVVGIAQRYARDGVTADDLIGEGTIGLIEAIRRFDDTVEGRLSTYAKWWIRARVRAFSLANRRLVALPSTRAARLVFARLATTERNLTQALGRPPTREEIAEVLEVPREELEAVLQALSADVHVSSEDDVLLADPAESAATPEQAFAEAEQRTFIERALARTRP